jgi:TP901 family phage tail tape measure protein
MSVDIGTLAGGIELEDKVSKSLDVIDARLKATGTSFEQLGVKIAASSVAQDRYSSAATILRLEIDKTQRSLSPLAKSMDDLQAMMVGASAAAKSSLEPELERLTKEYADQTTKVTLLKDALKNLDAQQKQNDEGFKMTGQSLISLGRGIEHTGIALTAGLTTPIMAAGAASIKFATDFEAAMTKAAVLGGYTAEQMEKFKQPILDISQQFGQMPKEVALGMDIIGSSGVKAEHSMEVLAVAAKMSAVGMGDVESTTRAVTGAMLAYENQNLTAAQAGDIFLNTVKLGNMKIDDLVGALGRVNPLAAAMGIKFGDVNAAIATFTHFGASADVAATGLRAVLSNILNDSPKTEKGLKALGLSMGELRDWIEKDGLAGALIHLTEVAGQVPEGMDKLNDVFPNVRALTLVLADAKAQSGLYKDITRQIADSNGILGESFIEVEKTWSFQLKRMGASAEVIGIKIGEALLPILKQVAEFFERYIVPAILTAVDAFEKLPVPVQGVAIAFVGLLAAVGPVLILVGELIRAWGAITLALESPAIVAAIALVSDAFIALGAVVMTIVGWPLLIAVAVGAILYYFGILGDTLDFFKNIGIIIGGALTKLVQNFVSGFVDGIKTAWEDLKNIVGDAVKWIVTSLTGMPWDVILKKWQDFKNTVSGVWVQIKDGVGQVAAGVQRMADVVTDQDKKIYDLAEKGGIKEYRKRVTDLNEGAVSTETAFGLLNGTLQATPPSTEGVVKGFGLMSETAEVFHVQLKELSPAVVDLTTRLFQQGYTSAEAYKYLLAHKQITEEQKVAVENLHDAYAEHEKALKKVDEANEAVMMAMVPLTAEQKKQIDTLLALKLSHEIVATAVGVHVAQINALIAAEAQHAKEAKLIEDLHEMTHKADLKRQDEELKKMKKTNDDIVKILNETTKLDIAAKDRRLKASVDSFTYEQVQIGLWASAEKAKYADFQGDTTSLYAAIDEEARARFENIMRNHNLAIEEMKKKEHSWANDLTDFLGGMPGLIKKAFTGGGGFEGALKAGLSGLGAIGGEHLITEPLMKLFNKVQGPLGDAIGGTLTGALGQMVPMIGPAIGALAPMIIPAFKKLFGMASAEELKGRESVAKFEDQIKSLLTTAEKAESGGVGWKMTVIGVRDAFLATGHSAEEAEAAVQRLWASSKMGADEQKAAQDAISVVLDQQKKNLEDQQKVIAENNTELGGYLQQFIELGGNIPLSMQSAIDKLVEMGGVTKDNIALFGQLAGNNEVDFKKMSDIAGKYKINLDDLGPAFQNAKLHDTAATIINDFDTLSRGGADVNVILGGMKDEISGLVQESLKFGVDIPENMRPWIEKLAESGDLTDENGRKITDLSELKFAAPIVTEFDKVLQKIQELIDKIGGDLTNKITNVPDVHVNGYIDWHNTEPPVAQAQGHAGGGLVYAASGFAGMFAPRGSDTVPAMLTPGERVLTVAENRAYEAGPQQPSNADVVDAVNGLRADMSSKLPRSLARSLHTALVGIRTAS